MGYVLIIAGIPFFFSSFVEILVNRQNQLRGTKTEITPLTYTGYKVMGFGLILFGLMLILVPILSS